MKRVSLLFLGLALVLFANAQSTLTSEERTKALEHMKQTQSELLKIVKGLSEEQLSYKPSAETWSVAECMEHIVISEAKLFGIIEGTLQGNPDPSLRSEVKMSDDQVLGLVKSREQKVKTRPDFEPDDRFGGFKGSVSAFKARRKANMKFVKDTEMDLRNRYFDFPFGKVDIYQAILFISGHTARHTDQIREIIASAGYPQA